MSTTNAVRSPRKRVAVALAALTLGLLGTVSPTPAKAATLQGVCSSKGSVIGSAVEIRNLQDGHIESLLYRGECSWMRRGQNRVTFRGAKSYRVGYNYGPYSKDCRQNSGFIPWIKADPIYFRLYTSSSCINP